MSSSDLIHCNRCKKSVTWHIDPVGHWKQLLLSIVTCGLWLPIWLGMALSRTKICDECNEPLWANGGE